MTMHINEAASYLNESVDNLRFMLMDAYPDTFDTLTELNEDQIELIEHIKGVTKDKPALLSVPAQQATQQIATQEFKGLELTEEVELLIKGALAVLAADAVKAGVISGTVRGQNFVAADRVAFDQVVVSHLATERERTLKLLTELVANNNAVAQLATLGIESQEASLGKFQAVQGNKQLDLLVAQVLKSSV